MPLIPTDADPQIRRRMLTFTPPSLPVLHTLLPTLSVSVSRSALQPVNSTWMFMKFMTVVAFSPIASIQICPFVDDWLLVSSSKTAEGVHCLCPSPPKSPWTLYPSKKIYHRSYTGSPVHWNLAPYCRQVCISAKGQGTHLVNSGLYIPYQTTTTRLPYSVTFRPHGLDDFYGIFCASTHADATNIAHLGSNTESCLTTLVDRPTRYNSLPYPFTQEQKPCVVLLK